MGGVDLDDGGDDCDSGDGGDSGEGGSTLWDTSETVGR